MLGRRLQIILSHSPFTAVLRRNDAAQIFGNPGRVIERYLAYSEFPLLFFSLKGLAKIFHSRAS